MVEPTYTIVPDAPREFLRLTLVGDWTAEIAARFAAEVITAQRELLAGGARRGELRTLVDMRRKNILPQDAVTEIARVIRPDSSSKRIALLIVRPLHRVQAKRMIDERYAIFDDEPAALSWLWADHVGEQ